MCVCACARAKHSCRDEVWGLTHEGPTFPCVWASWSPPTPPSFLTGRLCPRLGSGVFSPLALVKMFPRSRGVVWSDNGSFQTKPGHNKAKEKEKIKQNNSRDDKEFFEYICNIFNFVTISNQPHKLLTVSLVGGGWPVLVGLLGWGAERQEPPCLVFRHKATLAASPPGCGEATLRGGQLGLMDG